IRMREILSGVPFVIDRHQIRANPKCMFDATDGEWKGAAAMRERNTKFWEALKDAAEDHRTNGERTFGRHTNKPWQPVFRHPFPAHHVPGMNENCGVQLLRRFPDDVERWMIEVAAIGAVTMIVWIDMGADLDSAESELAHAAFQFLRGKIDILQRNCAEAGKLFRIRANDFGDVIV